MQLHDYQENLSKFHEAGAELVAVSPTNPDNSLTMTDKHALEFKVLSDAGNKVARRYGVVYDIPKELLGVYGKGGMVDITKYNDDEAMELPLAVTYVINTDGIVTYAFLNTDYRKRAETSEVLEEVRKLSR
jgi:peroxiredoxin